MSHEQPPVGGQTSEPIDTGLFEQVNPLGFISIDARSQEISQEISASGQHDQADAHLPPPHYSRRKAVLISGIITVIVLLITGVTLAFHLNRTTPPPASDQPLIHTQEVNLKQSGPVTLSPELQGDAESLLIEGNLIVRGHLKVVNGSASAVFDGQALTENQIYGLPDSSGMLCLDSNNCGYATQGQLAQSNATAARERRVTSINNQSGGLFLQGTPNQLAVRNENGTFTFSTPQDIHSGAKPTFAGMKLTGSLVVQGSNAAIGSVLQNGSLILYNNGYTSTISGNTSSADRVYTLPDGDGDFCLRQLGNCSGASGGNAPTGAQYLTLAPDGDLTAERTLVFSATNFNVTDGGPDGNYSVNTAQNINTAAAPSFAGLNLSGNLNMGANTIQGTAAVIDFTNFDVSSGGIVVAAGTIQGSRLISTVDTGTAPLTVSSATKVTNLNADLLDGLDSTAFAAGSGSGNYIQNGTSLQGMANFNIQSASAGSVGGIIRGAAEGQTADLFQLQNSDGATLVKVNAAGELKLYNGNGNVQIFGAGSNGSTTHGCGGNTTICIFGDNGGGNRRALSITGAIAGNDAFFGGTGAAMPYSALFTSSASNVTLMLRGAVSQSADLLQLQNSAGATLSRFNSSGQLYLGPNSYDLHTFKSGSTYGLDYGNGSGFTFALRANGSNIISVVDSNNFPVVISREVNINGTQNGLFAQTGTTATGAVITARGGISATGNLLQLQTSNGTNVAHVSSAGELTARNLFSTDGTVQSRNGNPLRLVGTGGEIRISNEIKITPAAGTNIYLGATATDRIFIPGFIGPQTPSSTALIIKGLPLQTSDLFQIQDSAGMVLSKFHADGSLTVGASLNVSGVSTLASLTVNGAAAFNGNISFSANMRGKNESVAAAATTLVVTGKIYPDADYSVLCTPNYDTSCYVTNKTATGFTLNFGTAASAGATADWIVVR